jgi:polyisoprenoid-binding protein YceI
MTRTQIATKTAQAFAVDKAHSEVTFQVRHLLTKVRGRFSDFVGTVRLDEEEPTNSSVSLTIDAGSVDTNTADRDQHLRSDDFFAIGTYPTITFDSSRIVRTSADAYDVTGTVTIRGVAREITLPVTYLERRPIRGATSERDSKPTSRSIAKTSGCRGTRPSRPAGSWWATRCESACRFRRSLSPRA